MRPSTTSPAAALHAASRTRRTETATDNGTNPSYQSSETIYTGTVVKADGSILYSHILLCGVLGSNAIVFLAITIVIYSSLGHRLHRLMPAVGH